MKERIIDMIVELNLDCGGPISTDYIERIAEHCVVDIMDDLDATADPCWNEDDLRLSFGRVLCNRLGIEY